MDSFESRSDLPDPAVREQAVSVRLSPDPGTPDPDRDARWAAWRGENAEAIEASNRWVEEHGLPLGGYRRF